MNVRTSVWVTWALLISGVVLSTAVCGDQLPGPTASPQPATTSAVEPVAEPTTTSAIEPAPQPTAASAVEPAPSEPELKMLLASSDISVGSNRLVFGLLDRQTGPLKDAEVMVSTFYLSGATQEDPKETVKAVFRKWPAGQGVYTAGLMFDASGDWGLGIVVTNPDGSTRPSSARIQVKETSLTPAIGADAPRSANKTARDVGLLEELTTDPDPDPVLYAMTIAEAIDAGKPVVTVFATPAYCTTATCGPQVDVLKLLKEEYKDVANFIHIEVFDNPHEIQGDLSRAQISPSVLEWNLPTEPWTFIVDHKGLIQAKFEGFATLEELKDALANTLQ